jgi:hypothetical protein
VEVYVPYEVPEEIELILAGKTLDILVERGVDILVFWRDTEGVPAPTS